MRNIFKITKMQVKNLTLEVFL